MKREEFDELPSRRLRRLSNRYRDLKVQIATLIGECDEIREEVVGLIGLGHYSTCTVYEVPKTKVREHTRCAYKAIRARTHVEANGH